MENCNIESFWNGLPGFKYPMYGKNGMGYGIIPNKPNKEFKKKHIRRAKRQMKKYGFNSSETWSLDYTFLEWLSDNYGGFFRICGCPDNWNEYDLEGNFVDFWKHYKDIDYWDNVHLWNTTRYNSFEKHLKDFLDNCTPEDYKKIAEFICPRLKYLCKHKHGWPAGDDFPKFEDWTNELNNMITKFEEGTYSPYFISYYWHLWD